MRKIIEDLDKQLIAEQTKQESKLSNVSTKLRDSETKLIDTETELIDTKTKLFETQSKLKNAEEQIQDIQERHRIHHLRQQAKLQQKGAMLRMWKEYSRKLEERLAKIRADAGNGGDSLRAPDEDEGPNPSGWTPTMTPTNCPEDQE